VLLSIYTDGIYAICFLFFGYRDDDDDDDDDD